MLEGDELEAMTNSHRTKCLKMGLDWVHITRIFDLRVFSSLFIGSSFLFKKRFR
jgi:hypothetical protein